MSEFTLSTGTIVCTESIEKAEYYPEDSLNSYGCHFGGAEMRGCPFLFVQLHDTTERVAGQGSEADALGLERAGVRVIRHAG